MVFFKVKKLSYISYHLNQSQLLTNKNDSSLFILT